MRKSEGMDNKLVKMYVENQKHSYELILTAVLIAVGVNVLSSGLMGLLNIPHKSCVMILLGALIAGLVVANLFIKNTKSLNRCINLKGFIVYDKTNKKIISIPRYAVSEKMSDYLRSAFAENKAMEKIWKADSEFVAISFDKEKNRETRELTKRGVLLVELLEYCIISKLTVHLCDYFNLFDGLDLEQISRIDIPDILLQNRFLKLFSEDMDNRTAFVDPTGPKRSSHILAAFSENALFEKFELVLPKKSKFLRKSKNEIIIDTPVVSIAINCDFDGTNTYIDSDFRKYYMGIQNYHYNDYDDYYFEVSVSTKFKKRALFSKKKDVYYAWIDSFIDSLSDFLDEDTFYKNINWETVNTMIICKKNINEELVNNHVG